MAKGKYDWSVNLPRTSFPMRANLPKREPQFIERWKEQKLYQKLLKRRENSPRFVLHDGPPYANGEIHMGHALNKVLKDMVVKYRIISGYNSPFVPGWDCHGLPIEHRVFKEKGYDKRTADPMQVRKECREFASHWVEVQKEGFIRLGVLGDWDNPYLTMDPAYQAGILKAFKEIYDRGYVYRDKKPVYWCPSCVTALAEAEVEYREHKSPSIYVAFELVEPTASIAQVVAEKTSGKKVYVLIWTTTPWTIPANLALAFHPDYRYSLFHSPQRDAFYIFASSLKESVESATGLEFEKVADFRGEDLEGLKAKHPLFDRTSVGILADFVTLEDGTGVVHIAPGHGEEDYQVGLKYGLQVFSPVNDEGRFTADAGKYRGKFVFDANEEIITDLQKAGALLGKMEITHSYPHCWRCKNPIIFRATDQWFLNVDHSPEGGKTLREKAIEEVERKVNWVPAWGRERIKGMLENRPHWCLSRQRFWGVPIPVLVCKNCGHSWLDEELFEEVYERTQKEGIDFWFSEEFENYVAENFSCPRCGAREVSPGKDILDVWFDSGVSHFNVLMGDRWDLSHPADLYLEGSDQHRGWFQVSLLTSVALLDKAPYREVLTHGFLLDEEGKAMHKSHGNVIPPSAIIEKYGADVLRLWVASEDYRGDVPLGFNILAQIADSYRKIRNSFRFMLGNLFDFSPEKSLPKEDMLPVDRWILSSAASLIEELKKLYEKYEFYRIYRRVIDFFSVDLSAIYMDVVKDRLYVEHPDSKERLSAQTAIFLLLKSLNIVLAPVLSFTMEEVHDRIKEDIDSSAADSVFLEDWPEWISEFRSPEIDDLFEFFREVRDVFTVELEKARKDGLLSSSLEASAEVFLPERVLKKYLSDERAKEALREFLIVSHLKVEEGSSLKVSVGRAPGSKCARCWRYSTTVGEDPEYPDLCERCVLVVRKLK